MLLDQSKVKYSEASLLDDFGRVFFYDGRVFRAIYVDKEDYCKDLLGSPLFKQLTEEHLVPKTWITSYKLDGYSLILEHEKITESGPHHWSFTMFKNAALALLKVRKICNDHGYELKDAHPYNIFFDKLRPVYIDIGSIVKSDSHVSWPAYEQFITSFYVQLLVWRTGDFFLARKLIEDGVRTAFRTIPMNAILNSLFIQKIGENLFEFRLFVNGKPLLSTSREIRLIRDGLKVVQSLCRIFFKRQIKLIRYDRRLRPVVYVRNQIEKMGRPVGKSMWSNYHDAYKQSNQIIAGNRFHRIIEIVRTFAPDIRSCTDLAGNQGVFSRILMDNFVLDKIILSDYDEQALDIAFQSFINEDRNVNLYLYNFMRPVRQEDVALLRSDIVFALAVTHHLVLSQKYPLSEIFRILQRHSLKYVVVEFMPKGLWSAGDQQVNIPGWYTLEWFQDEFEKWFETIVYEKIEENRIVFLGKIKD